MVLRRSSLFLLLFLTVSEAALLTGKVLLHQVPLAHLPVTVFLLDKTLEEKTTTNEQGIFQFTLPSSSTKHYIVRAVYKKVPFFEGPVTLPKPSSKKSLRVQVYPVKKAPYPKFFLTDLYSLSFAQNKTFIERQITFYNESGEVLLPPRPFLLPLPHASDITLAKDPLIPCCVRKGKNKILLSQPLYPGGNEFTFQYSLPRKDQRFTFFAKALHPTGRIAFVLPYTPLPIEQKGFQKKEKIETKSGVYWALQKGDVKKGEHFSIEIPLPQKTLYPYVPLLLTVLLFFSLFLRKTDSLGDPSDLDFLARAHLLKESRHQNKSETY